MHKMHSVVNLHGPSIYWNTGTSSSMCPKLWTVSLKCWHVNLINRIRTAQGLRVCVWVHLGGWIRFLKAETGRQELW